MIGTGLLEAASEPGDLIIPLDGFAPEAVLDLRGFIVIFYLEFQVTALLAWADDL